jgi:hypothetical protein
MLFGPPVKVKNPGPQDLAFLCPLEEGYKRVLAIHVFFGVME